MLRVFRESFFLFVCFYNLATFSNNPSQFHVEVGLYWDTVGLPHLISAQLCRAKSKLPAALKVLRCKICFINNNTGLFPLGELPGIEKILYFIRSLHFSEGGC